MGRVLILPARPLFLPAIPTLCQRRGGPSAQQEDAVGTQRHVNSHGSPPPLELSFRSPPDPAGLPGGLWASPADKAFPFLNLF